MELISSQLEKNIKHTSLDKVLASQRIQRRSELQKPSSKICTSCRTSTYVVEACHCTGGAMITDIITHQFTALDLLIRQVKTASWRNNDTIKYNLE
jgi:hypothetical protein